MNLKNLLDKMFIRADLANHAVWGIALYWAGSWIDPVVGFLLAAFFAVFKDVVVDKKMGHGQFDPWDIFATVILPFLFLAQELSPWIL